eukprot:CAMPEP_0118640058 /NCGR_PEP_ID=MMETSP0785-20121206/4553_1 /TAXON_ID=91992 /ORGANISM="Bolidomonas pacifica, Strain CCMP 1866" /LENGTH=51 /DNA_ID=CAMNT_0006531425 /DNA_START=533 /DNA_END=688 /DNA_ORIENTATION=-
MYINAKDAIAIEALKYLPITAPTPLLLKEVKRITEYAKTPTAHNGTGPIDE